MWKSPAAMARAARPPRLTGATAAGGSSSPTEDEAAVAEPALAAVAPAAHGAGVEDGARVGRAGRDRHRPPAEVDRRHGGGEAHVGRVAVAEPAVGAEAPALHRAVVEDRAGVEVARGDGAGGAAAAEVDRRGRARRDDVGLRAVAEAAGQAPAPAAQRAVGEDRASVLDPGVQIAGLNRPRDGRGGLRIGARGDEQGERGDECTGCRQPRPASERSWTYPSASYHSAAGESSSRGRTRLGGRAGAARHPPRIGGRRGRDRGHLRRGGGERICHVRDRAPPARRAARLARGPPRPGAGLVRPPRRRGGGLVGAGPVLAPALVLRGGRVHGVRRGGVPRPRASAGGCSTR